MQICYQKFKTIFKTESIIVLIKLSFVILKSLKSLDWEFGLLNTYLSLGQSSFNIRWPSDDPWLARCRSCTMSAPLLTISVLNLGLAMGDWLVWSRTVVAAILSTKLELTSVDLEVAGLTYWLAGSLVSLLTLSLSPSNTRRKNCLMHTCLTIKWNWTREHTSP